MKYGPVAFGLCAIALVIASLASTQTAHAAASLQLPWPTGHQHRIYGGWTYGCPSGPPYYGTHDRLTATSSTAYNADYYAIDFQFGSVDGSPLDVAAAAGGKIVRRGDYIDGYGNKVVIDHDDGQPGDHYFSVYAHLASIDSGIVLNGKAAQGRFLGNAGKTGSPDYPVHLHFQMQYGLSAYKAEPMSGVPAPGEHGFGWYGYSQESGLGCGNNSHDPSPYWKSLPSFDRDFGIDTCSDVMARSGDIAKVYAGNCQTGFAGSYQIASGLLNFNKLLQTGDFNGDRCIDMLAANSSGVMYLYPGNWNPSPGNCTAGFGTRVQIGSGWNAYLDVFGPGDFDGDGCNDVMGRNVAWTTLYLWRGNCAANGVYWKDNGIPAAIGSGWTIRDKVWSVGDFDADGCLDVMARDNPTSAKLFLYRGGCGNGTYWRNNGVGIQVGSGFTGTNELIGPGDFNRSYFDDKRCTDLIWKVPPAYLYVGNCGGTPPFGNNGSGFSMGENFTGMTLVP
jgi:hypothetical protein